MADALRVAIVGAESTGKTTLAATLAQQLAQRTGGHTRLRVAWVPEVLREWCAHTGRTPQAHEQASILRSQQERIDEAAATHEIVVCDTTPLMTAVYSRLIFADASLDQRAVDLHRRVALTLLMAIDLPWVADGQQRDGPQVRAPVDALLRGLLLAHRLPFAVVGGVGETRVAQALAALAPLLREARRGPDASGPTGPRRTGLFSGLAGTPAAATQRRWSCECCVAEYERALLKP